MNNTSTGKNLMKRLSSDRRLMKNLSQSGRRNDEKESEVLILESTYVNMCTYTSEKGILQCTHIP